jgi:hypothetical protein
VGDEHVRERQLGLEILEQVEDLRLDRLVACVELHAKITNGQERHRREFPD